MTEQSQSQPGDEMMAHLMKMYQEHSSHPLGKAHVNTEANAGKKGRGKVAKKSGSGRGRGRKNENEIAENKAKGHPAGPERHDGSHKAVVKGTNRKLNEGSSNPRTRGITQH